LNLVFCSLSFISGLLKSSTFSSESILLLDRPGLKEQRHNREVSKHPQVFLFIG
jgi:hypothetical protein